MHAPNLAADLDTPLYLPADVAEATGLAPKAVANWTDRGLGQPYGARHGRGNARLYGLRDVVRFSLVGYLTGTGVSVVGAIRLAEQALGDAFAPAQARFAALAYTALEAPADPTGEAAWHSAVRHLADTKAVADYLAKNPVALIVDLAGLFRTVEHRASEIRQRKTAAGTRRD